MIDLLVEDFLLADAEEAKDGVGTRKGKGRQIISVGAGSDARYWRIMVSCFEPESQADHRLTPTCFPSILPVK
jgi:hypothetical protein